jgi:hypothetical protein
VTVTIAEFRAWALALPETSEVVTWGDLTWRVRDRMFAIGGTESPRITVKASREDQAELISMAPETYAIAAYVGRFGWVSVDLATVDADELRQLLVDAWRRTAPKRLVSAYDAV